MAEGTFPKLKHSWDLLDALINLIFVCSYIYLTFYSLGKRNQEIHPPPAPPSLLNADLALAYILLLNWLPSIYLAFDPWRTLSREFFSHLSILSTLPVIWVAFWRHLGDDSLLSAGDVVFVYPFRFWRLHYSLMRVLNPDPNAVMQLHPVTREAAKLGISIFSTLFTVAAWVHICLYRVQKVTLTLISHQKYYDLSFFDVFYTIAVSSTSGLSTQIVPDNIFSRIITLVHSFACTLTT